MYGHRISPTLKVTKGKDTKSVLHKQAKKADWKAKSTVEKDENSSLSAHSCKLMLAVCNRDTTSSFFDKETLMIIHETSRYVSKSLENKRSRSTERQAHGSRHLRGDQQISSALKETHTA